MTLQQTLDGFFCTVCGAVYEGDTEQTAAGFANAQTRAWVDLHAECKPASLAFNEFFAGLHARGQGDTDEQRIHAQAKQRVAQFVDELGDLIHQTELEHLTHCSTVELIIGEHQTVRVPADTLRLITCAVTELLRECQRPDGGSAVGVDRVRPEQLAEFYGLFLTTVWYGYWLRDYELRRLSA